MAPLVYLFLGLAVAAPDLVRFHAAWRRPEGTGWIMSASRDASLGSDVTATCYQGAKDGAPVWTCDVVGAPAPVADYAVLCPADDNMAEACVLCVAVGDDVLTKESAVAQDRAFHARMGWFLASDPGPAVANLLPPAALPKTSGAPDLATDLGPDISYDLAFGIYLIAVAFFVCTVSLCCGELGSTNFAVFGMCTTRAIVWYPLLLFGVYKILHSFD